MTDDGDHLEPVEADAWSSLNALLIRLPPVLDARMRQVGGLAHFEFQVLVHLSRAPRRSMRIGELATASRGSISRISHLVKRLEGRSLVRREVSANGRNAEVLLTEAGHALMVAMTPHYRAAVRQLISSCLSREQLGQLHTLVDLITAGIPDER